MERTLPLMNVNPFEAHNFGRLQQQKPQCFSV